MEIQNWLGDLYLFVAVAQAKSFTRAAAALDVSRSTVSRRVRDLEKAIGLRLLNRTTRYVELTEDGASYLIRAERIVEDARMAHEGLRERVDRPVGLLRVSMPASIAWHLAMPWLAEFAGLYPDLRLEIDTSPDYINLVADKWDLCIHDNVVRDSSLTIRKLATYERSLFASPQYINSRTLPSHPDDLTSHECICAGPKTSNRTIWKMNRGVEKVEVSVSGRIVCSSIELSPAFARQGVGIAPAVTGAYAADVVQGTLLSILPEWQFEPLVICATIPTRLVPAKTRIFLDFFAGKMKETESEARLASKALW